MYNFDWPGAFHVTMIFCKFILRYYPGKLCFFLIIAFLSTFLSQGSQSSKVKTYIYKYMYMYNQTVK